MIIGLIGPVQEDIQFLLDILTQEKQIQVVDGIGLVRAMNRKQITSIISKDYHKKLILKQLEAELGTYIITGNLLLTQDVCKWILDNEGTVIVVSRNSLESYGENILKDKELYYGDSNTQRYELEFRFKKVFEELNKVGDISEKLYLIDVSDDSQQINDLVRKSQEWKNSNSYNLGIQYLVKFLTGKEDKHMNMEDSIKKAMKELGIDFDNNEPSKPVIEPVKPVENKQQPVRKPIKSQPAEEIPEKQETSDTNKDTINSVFVKVTDTTMALLLPAGIKFEKQVIGGIEFNVTTVSIPDLKDRKLQELEIKLEKPSKTVEKPKAVKNSEDAVVKKPSKTVVASGSLEDLQAEKARLDNEIKKYRSEGNMDMVNSLRKQRRAVRNKINILK